MNRRGRPTRHESSASSACSRSAPEPSCTASSRTGAGSTRSTSTAVALTTVGFGDLTPSTDLSKLFTVFYIFSGISLIGALLNEFMKRHARRMNTHTGESTHRTTAHERLEQGARFRCLTNLPTPMTRRRGTPVATTTRSEGCTSRCCHGCGRVGTNSWMFVGMVFGLALIIALIAATRDITAPLAVGTFVAIVCAPIVTWLQDHGLKRAAGAGIVLVGLVVVFAGCVLITAEALGSQSEALSENLSKAVDEVKTWAADLPIGADAVDEVDSTAQDAAPVAHDGVATALRDRRQLGRRLHHRAGPRNDRALLRAQRRADHGQQLVATAGPTRLGGPRRRTSSRSRSRTCSPTSPGRPHWRSSTACRLRSGCTSSVCPAHSPSVSSTSSAPTSPTSGRSSEERSPCSWRSVTAASAWRSRHSRS